MCKEKDKEKGETTMGARVIELILLGGEEEGKSLSLTFAGLIGLVALKDRRR